MKTIKEIKDTFSIDEIKILSEIVKGKQDFDVMGDEIKDFYSDEYEPTENSDEYDKEILLEKLEFDLEMGGLL
jgi:hypothetical protein